MIQVTSLLRKEVQQLLHGRAAVVSQAILPFIALVLVPLSIALLFADRAATREATALIDGANDVLLPPLVLIAGLSTPYGAVIHSILSERERRTLELLVPLHVSIRAILGAKMLVGIGGALALLFPLYAFQTVALSFMGSDTGRWPSLLVLLGASVASSTAIATIGAILARDQRTASNAVGLGLAAVMCGGAIYIVSGGVALDRVFLVAAMLFTGAAVTAAFALWLADPELYLR